MTAITIRQAEITTAQPVRYNDVHLIDSLRAQGCIRYPGNVDPRGEDFAPRNQMIYITERVPDAQKHALAGAQKLLEKNASPEWNAKAQRLLYMVHNNVPVYGATAE